VTEKASGCEVELSRNRFTNQEAFVSHANAALTPRARLRLAQLIVESGWTYAAAAKMFMVAPRTARKWADRYRVEGSAGMVDRSSRPHTSPTRTAPSNVRQIVRLRWRLRLGPVQIAGRLGMPASTVHAVLTRCRINRLSRIDRVTGEPLRRYEHAHPGALIHVDVTKFANIPDGGGHKFVSRQQGRRNAIATGYRTGKRGDPATNYRPRIGTAFVHTVIDDHSRMAYAEICTDEKAATAVTVLRRAVAWFADRGVTVERVLSDNGPAYLSLAWRDACTELGVTPKRTRPYRPQTNGKIERFHRTMADGWAYARYYESTEQRDTALSAWLHFYNHHRAHSAIGGQPPVTRLTNLPGHHN
jgi:transposase InsO family protein